LLPIAGVHIYAAPISTLACNLTVLVIEAAVLARVLKFRAIGVSDLFRPLLSAATAVGVSAAVYLLLGARMGERGWLMPLALVLAAALYLLLALLLRAVGREELESLPAGDRLCRVLLKCKLLK
jgi:hypothetical protein